MKRYVTGLALAACAFTALPAKAALVISEALANEVGSDTAGEFIEIYNTGTTAIDLTNYKIGDEETSGGTGTGEVMHLFPAGASIGPRQVQVIAASATRFFTVYGFLPTYELSSTDATVPDLGVYSAWDPDGGIAAMANTNDHALILDPSDSVVDAVNWGNNTFLNPGIDITTAPSDGQSFERSNVYIDTNTRNDWQFGPTSTVAAQRSTPGVARVPEPATLGMAVVAGLLFVRLRQKPCSAA
jgi:hypothetical protein